MSVPMLMSRRDQESLRALARRLDPADAGAHNNLGVLYFNKGMLDDAVAMFVRALELQPRLRVATRNLEIVHGRPEYAERRMAALREAVSADPSSREPRLALGRAYALAGRHEAAVAEYAALLEADALDVEAMLQAGLAVKASGDLAEAQRWLERAARLAPERAEVRLALGEVLYNRGLTEGALAELERAVELDGDDPDAHHLLGFVLGDLGRHDAAQAAAARAVELNPAMARPEAHLSLEIPAGHHRPPRTGDEEATRASRATPARPACDGRHLAHFNLGLAFRHKGYFVEAAREYEMALARGEERGLVLQALAEVRLLQRDTLAAIALYDELLAAAPHSPKLWNERGIALHQAGRVTEARASYEAAIRADAGYALAMNNLGVALHHLGLAAGAGAAFQGALREEPRFVKALVNCALHHVREGRPDDAREFYRRALAVDPEQAVAWNGLGRTYLDQRQFVDARPAFARAIQARPGYAEAYYNLGFALSNLGDFDGALDATRRALELDPFYVSQRFELAIDLEYESPDLTVVAELESEQRGSEPVAAFSFDSAALETMLGSLAPIREPAGRAAGSASPAEEALQLVERAGRFVLMGAHGEALERCDQALALVPGLESAQSGAVRALLALARVDEARARLDALLRDRPDDPELLVLRADAAMAAGEPALARRWAERAVAVAPHRADALQRVGDALTRVGDLAAAADAYRDALALDPDLAAVRRSLATLFAGAGLPGAAEEQLRQALETVPTYSAAALDLAVLLRERGRPDEARELLVATLGRDPHDLAALAELADLLLASGAAADAQVAVTRVLRLDPSHAGALYVQGELHARQHRMREAVACWHEAIATDVTGVVAERARAAAARAGLPATAGDSGDAAPLGLVA